MQEHLRRWLPDIEKLVTPGAVDDHSQQAGEFRWRLPFAFCVTDPLYKFEQAQLEVLKSRFSS